MLSDLTLGSTCLRNVSTMLLMLSSDIGQHMLHQTDPLLALYTKTMKLVEFKKGPVLKTIRRNTLSCIANYSKIILFLK